MKKIFTLLFLTTTFLGFAQSPTTSASAPTAAAASVVSIYSDAYTDVSGTNFNPGWGQSTTLSAFNLGTDSMLKYAAFNYQGIEFGADQNVSGKGFLHIDIWTATSFTLDIYCISRTTGEKKVAKMLIANQWNSFDISLADYTSQGLSTSNLFQFKFDDLGRTNSTVFLDNIYFYGTPAVTEPVTAAPAPTDDPMDVISIYSEAFNNIAGTNYSPGWGQSTTKSDFIIGTDTMIKYSNLNYQGIEFGSDVDASTMQFLHLDVWSASVSNLDVSPISRSTGEKKVTKALNAMEWNSINIPLSDYTSQTLAITDLFQFKFEDPDGKNGAIFLDNVYFYTVPVPTVAATAPTAKVADVISIYSQSYTNIPTVNLFPSWGQSTQFVDFAIGTDSMIKYSNLNYQGIEFGADVDVSAMTKLHMDVWTSNVSNLDIFPISKTPGEKKVTKALTPRAWTTIEIPMTDYTSQGLSVTDLFQFKFVDPDDKKGTIYLDNIYFSKPETNSVKELAFNRFNVYPNPATNAINLEAIANAGVILSYTLQNVNGQTISTKTINSAVVSETINTTGLEAGIYFLQVNAEQGTYTHKVILQ
jgi:hypothetical protein